MIQAVNGEIAGAPGTMAAFAIGRAAGGAVVTGDAEPPMREAAGSSPREMETW
jgi:hypothetical protein